MAKEIRHAIGLGQAPWEPGAIPKIASLDPISVSSDVQSLIIPSSLHPNEPLGLAPIYYNPGIYGDLPTGFGPGGLNPWEMLGYNDDVDIVTSASVGIDPNPTGESSVIRHIHQNGSGAGNAVLQKWDHLAAPIAGPQTDGHQNWTSGPCEEQYISFRFFVPSTGPNLCGDHGFKMPGYFGVEQSGRNQQPGKPIQFFLATGNTGGCNTWLWQIQNPPSSGEVFQSFNTPPDQWNHFEIRMQAESANGAADGEFDWYVNGVLVESLTDMFYSSTNATGRLLDGMQWVHHQIATDPTHTWYEGEMYVSGRTA